MREDDEVMQAWAYQLELESRMYEEGLIMSKEMANKNDEMGVMDRALVMDDLSGLTESERMLHYKRVCESLGLNPLTNPFAYIKLNGKLKLYVKKDCTEQLRKTNGISVQKTENQIIASTIYITKTFVIDKSGRTDVATGAVDINGLRGEALANAIMKSETKSKRRATLSISGLGFLDESEIETIPAGEFSIFNSEDERKIAGANYIDLPEKTQEPLLIEQKKESGVLFKSILTEIEQAKTIESLKATYEKSQRLKKNYSKEEIKIIAEAKDKRKEEIKPDEAAKVRSA